MQEAKKGPGGGRGERRGVRRVLYAIGAIVLGGAALVGVFQGLVAGIGDGESDPDAAFLPVLVERGDLRETVVASGTMEPLVRVPVIAEVSGIIAAVHVEEGERVQQGQPLFELDTERLEARVAERRAELQLREAHAMYDVIGRAEAGRDQKQRERDRTATLYEKKIASAQELERVEHALRLAEIELRDAAAERAARRAAVAQARELLRQAVHDLANAVVRAPIDGVVIERQGEIGRAVADVTANGGTVIAVIADDKRIRLVAEVDENDVARVRVGQESLVSIDAFPDEEFVGRVRKISAAGTIEGNVSNFEVEIELDPDERLRVGMSSDARVVVQEHRSVLLIPNTALVRNGRGLKVRIGADGEAEMLPIRTGYTDGFLSVVEDGLQEGDTVLVRSEGA